MFVPVIFTMIDEAASGRNVSDMSRDVLVGDAPLTCPKMTAPDGPAPMTDGAAGETDALPPHAVAVAAKMARKITRQQIRVIRTLLVRLLSSWQLPFPLVAMSAICSAVNHIQATLPACTPLWCRV
jgi:hypothetical protein